MSEGLKPCPFCGRGYLIVRTVYSNKKYFAVNCRHDNCRAEGPMASTDQQAIKLWNERHTDE